MNRKVLLPPLGLVTVATLLPQEWEMKLVDRNVREVTDEEWNWAELVIILVLPLPPSAFHKVYSLVKFC